MKSNQIVQGVIVLKATFNNISVLSWHKLFKENTGSLLIFTWFYVVFCRTKLLEKMNCIRVILTSLKYM